MRRPMRRLVSTLSHALLDALSSWRRWGRVAQGARPIRSGRLRSDGLLTIWIGTEDLKCERRSHQITAVTKVTRAGRGRARSSPSADATEKMLWVPMVALLSFQASLRAPTHRVASHLIMSEEDVADEPVAPSVPTQPKLMDLKEKTKEQRKEVSAARIERPLRTL